MHGLDHVMKVQVLQASPQLRGTLKLPGNSPTLGPPIVQLSVDSIEGNITPYQGPSVFILEAVFCLSWSFCIHPKLHATCLMMIGLSSWPLTQVTINIAPMVGQETFEKSLLQLWYFSPTHRALKAAGTVPGTGSESSLFYTGPSEQR